MPEALRLDQVSFRYPQEGHGVSPVSITLEHGQSWLLSGVSGSGKSTVARLACGLIPHLYHGQMEGQVFLFGQPVSQQPLWALSEQAGMVFQNPASQMLTHTVEEEIIFGLENLGLTPAEIRQRVEESLVRFGLEGMHHRAPQTLSGGEQQKLALACVLARQTPLLVLDEPLSMLDSTAAHDLVTHLSALENAGQTLLICEHRQAYLHRLPDLRIQSLTNGRHQPATQAELPNVPTRAETLSLEIDQLHVQRGGNKILDGLNLSLRGGQFVALVGRNGTGKTTLLRAIAGLQPYQGTLTVRTPSGSEPPAFSMVFQNPDVQLFRPSARDELLYRLPNPDMDWFHWLLHSLGLERYEHTPPLLLSEGEKRRVALATALMRKAPHGILLDEPTLGQDANHKAILLRVLQQLAGAGYLVLVATHDLELASHADTLLLLGTQGLVAQGHPAALMADTGLWERLGLWLPDWLPPMKEGARPC